MTDLYSQWSKTTRPTGDASPYRSSSLSLGRGSQAELKVKFDIGVDNLNNGDIWNFVRLPADAVIDQVMLTTSELDAGTALTLTIQADDGTTESALLTADDVAQTGGSVFAGSNLPYVGGDSEVEVRVVVANPPTTAQAGEATLTVRFTRA